MKGFSVPQRRGGRSVGVPPDDRPKRGDHRKVLHIIGHSHIDAAWLWPRRDGADSVLDTFRSALKRMDETPGFCYTHTSAAHYRWAERADPALFAQVKQRIREGRWEVAGGGIVEPDCNLLSTESFVRQSLYGKGCFRRALGVDVKIAMNPDSFGHAAGPSFARRNAPECRRGPESKAARWAWIGRWRCVHGS